MVYYSVPAVKKMVTDNLTSYSMVVFTPELHSVESLIGIYLCYFQWKVEAR